MRRRICTIALAGSLSWVGACEGESTQEVTPGTARDTLAEGLAEAMCDGAATCCTQLGFGAPGDACRTSMRNAVMQAIIAAEDEARELRAEHTDACVAAFRAAMAETADCDELPSPFDLTARCPDVFSPAPEGPGAPGDACAAVHECSSPSEPGERACVALTAGSVCVWFVERSEGQPCAPAGGVIPQCGEALGCVPSAPGVEPQCGPPAQPGAACLPGPRACVSAHACSADLQGARTCVPEIPTAQDCSERPDACVKGDYCDALDLVCTPLPDPCADGDCPTLIMKNVCR